VGKRGLTLSLLALLTAIITGYMFLTTRGGGKRGTADMFALYLPWDDSSDTVVSLSSRLHKPAGKYGHVHVGPDGHLYVGNKRVKFLGVNICGSAAFPKKDDAEKIAARLAKFGVNCVRFHHMDAFWESFNIFDKSYGDTRHLNPAALERLDYFIAKLKENGIYVDLNLLVSRRFRAADGLPPEIEEVDWKDQQVLGFFVDKVRQLEKEYARQLLLHRNPYTGMTYAEDPAVAFVEIVNENGLIHSWLGGVIDRLPQVFKDELRAKWNEWLRRKYGSQERLLEAWGGRIRVGEEMLLNGRFEEDLEGWSVEVHDGAQASYDIVELDGMKALRIEVLKKGSANWHVQFNYPGLTIEEGRTYVATFMAKSDDEATILVSLRQAHEPWKALSNVVEVKLTREWRTYRIALAALGSDSNARLDITNLGALETTYYFANFSLKPFTGATLKEGESLERGTINIFTLSEYWSRPPRARRDWIEFLWELERDYFTDMYHFLKNELGVKALVIGTIAGCSTLNIMAGLDVVDTHAYWQHPVFPGRPWDPNNWYVINEPMVNHPEEGTIPWLALRRVYGKPFTVTEYNHPAPNMYDAEAYVTLATYAALQDWDGIFAFDYGSLNDWDSRRIRGYFDIDQHPAKMATLILAHMIFVRGDVEPAHELIAEELSPESEIELIARGKVWAWDLPSGRHLGMSPSTPLIHRVAIVTGGVAKPRTATKPSSAKGGGPVYESDNGQVIWNCSEGGRGVLVVNTARTVAIVGFGGGKHFDFGTVIIQPGETLLGGYAVIGLTAVDDKALRESRRMLLIAVGYVANTGMEVREYGSNKVVARIAPGNVRVETFNGKITCSGSWGRAPTLVEGVRATIAIRAEGGVEVWALDNLGNRKTRVPVDVKGEWAIFTIGPEYETIWYEVVRK